MSSLVSEPRILTKLWHLLSYAHLTSCWLAREEDSGEPTSTICLVHGGVCEQQPMLTGSDFQSFHQTPLITKGPSSVSLHLKEPIVFLWRINSLKGTTQDSVVWVQSCLRGLAGSSGPILCSHYCMTEQFLLKGKNMEVAIPSTSWGLELCPERTPFF